MMLTGTILVSALVVTSVGVGVASVRSSYTGRFWQMPLDEKLDHVADHRRDWWVMSIGHLLGLTLTTAGIFGLVSLIVDSGERTMAFTALGIHLMALITWVVGVLVQTTTVPRAASSRTETGTTPDWMQPFWDLGWMAELSWVIGSNVAYTVLGVALLQGDLLSPWAGWTAVALGVAIVAVVITTRYAFPEMGMIVPTILGVALLISL